MNAKSPFPVCEKGLDAEAVKSNRLHQAIGFTVKLDFSFLKSNGLQANAIGQEHPVTGLVLKMPDDTKSGAVGLVFSSLTCPPRRHIPPNIRRRGNRGRVTARSLPG